YQERGGDAGVTRLDAFLLQRVGERLRKRRHDLELLRAQRLRVLERARKGDEPWAGETRALSDLNAPERVEDRLAVRPRPDRLTELARALGDLVEEEIFLRREVIEDGL